MDKTSRQLDFSGTPARVPRFFLYGEPPREAAEGFVHVETIADRSRLYDWKISPHAHRDLNQLLLIMAGGGEMRVESGVEPFAAPALLIVPATLVHAFEFERETVGHVVSIAESSLRDAAARERALLAVFGSAAVLSLAASGRDAAELADAAVQLRRETVWSAPAQRIAAEARLAILLVGVARALAHHGVVGGSPRGRAYSSLEALPAGPPCPGVRRFSAAHRTCPSLDALPARASCPGVRRFSAAHPRAALVARFRDVLDERFRSGWPLARYARELGVSPERLRAACLDVTGKPPLRLVHERLVLEAKRLLTYTPLTVAQTAYELGFDDPAYFSRFFSEHAGEPPIAFRRRTAGPDG